VLNTEGTTDIHTRKTILVANSLLRLERESKMTSEGDQVYQHLLGRHFRKVHIKDCRRDMEYPRRGFKKAVINDFFLSDITCCDIWDILYESAISKLQLEISGRHVWWLLYRKVPSETGLHDSKRFQLEKFPIACCIPHGQCEITNGQWELWLPQEKEMRSILQFHAPPRFPRPFGVSIVLVL
jgi:hypothetical protein